MQQCRDARDNARRCGEVFVGLSDERAGFAASEINASISASAGRSARRPSQPTSSWCCIGQGSGRLNAVELSIGREKRDGPDFQLSRRRRGFTERPAIQFLNRRAGGDGKIGTQADAELGHRRTSRMHPRAANSVVKRGGAIERYDHIVDVLDNLTRIAIDEQSRAEQRGADVSFASNEHRRNRSECMSGSPPEKTTRRTPAAISAASDAQDRSR